MFLGLKVSVKCKHQHHTKIEQTQSLFKKILSSLKVWHADDNKTSSKESKESFKTHHNSDYETVAHRYKELYYYEDNRQERLKECMQQLIIHQSAAARYNYAHNDLAREYLLKARYKEDQENFMQSFSIEPSLLGFDM